MKYKLLVGHTILPADCLFFTRKTYLNEPNSC